MGTVFLIPTFLAENVIAPLPAYLLDAIKTCQVLFVENERSARRYLKLLDKAIIIERFEWHTIHKAEVEQVSAFKRSLSEGKIVGIISEAGCPGIADPGQLLIAAAQEMNVKVKPLVGPSAVLLALMASGMNGQQFEFVGYLPIDSNQRNKSIRELESHSMKNDSTKIFIETPYRNNALFESLLQNCSDRTRLCVGVNITGEDELITTRTVREWKKNKPILGKLPVIFLLYAGK